MDVLGNPKHITHHKHTDVQKNRPVHMTRLAHSRLPISLHITQKLLVPFNIHVYVASEKYAHRQTDRHTHTNQALRTLPLTIAKEKARAAHISGSI